MLRETKLKQTILETQYKYLVSAPFKYILIGKRRLVAKRRKQGLLVVSPDGSMLSGIRRSVVLLLDYCVRGNIIYLRASDYPLEYWV